MRVRLSNRSWVAGGFAMAVVVLTGAVLAAGGGAWLQRTLSGTPAPASCNLYPIALPDAALTGRVPGDVVERLPRGSGPGQFSWLTWTSDPAAVTLARSLIPPGDSYLYTEPGQPSDRQVDPGDWVEGAPGAMNSALVRGKLSALLGSDIVLPAYDATRGRGNRFDYRVSRFAVVRLRAFDLTGQGSLSFEFRGFRSCHGNAPPQATAQSVATPEDTALPIRLAGTDPENAALTYEVRPSRSRSVRSTMRRC